MGLSRNWYFLGSESASVFFPDPNLYLPITLCPLICLIFFPWHLLPHMLYMYYYPIHTHTHTHTHTHCNRLNIQKNIKHILFYKVSPSDS